MDYDTWTITDFLGCLFISPMIYIYLALVLFNGIALFRDVFTQHRQGRRRKDD